jgi:hypothetical protein
MATTVKPGGAYSIRASGVFGLRIPIHHDGAGYSYDDAGMATAVK